MIANPNDGNTPKVEQATPQISVSAAGLITATADQQEGYVPGGTKSATQQLATQGAKTMTPGRTAQTAVTSGYYTTGDVTVAGDANLVAENIAEGVSIFGVQGTHSGGGGSGETFTVTNNTSFKIYGVTESEYGPCPCYIDGFNSASVKANSVIIYVNSFSAPSITGNYKPAGYVEFIGNYYPSYLILGDVIFASGDI